MKQREYPCIVLEQGLSDGNYCLSFYMKPFEFFLIDMSSAYNTLAGRALRNSFEINVPFYNEAQS